MALLTIKGKDLPPGAVRLTEEEALTHQRNVVENWPSAVEVFFLKYGSILMGASTLISSTLIVNHYKRVVRANWKVFAFTFFPAAVVPTYFCMTSTESWLTNNILLMKEKCPLCYHLRFATAQYFGSLFFPTLYGLSTCSAYAQLTKAYNFPDLNKPKFIQWNMLWGIFKTGSKILQRVALLQTALILILPIMQAKEFLNVMENLKDDNYDSEILES